MNTLNYSNATNRNEHAFQLLFVPLESIMPTIVIARTFCASPDTRISYPRCLLTRQRLLRGLKLSGESKS